MFDHVLSIPSNHPGTWKLRQDYSAAEEHFNYQFPQIRTFIASDAFFKISAHMETMKQQHRPQPCWNICFQYGTWCLSQKLRTNLGIWENWWLMLERTHQRTFCPGGVFSIPRKHSPLRDAETGVISRHVCKWRFTHYSSLVIQDENHRESFRFSLKVP